MEENLRLSLFAQSNHFEEWLRQFVPESGDHFKYLDLDGDTSVYIQNPDANISEEKHSKILGSPKATISPQGDRQYDIEFCQGGLEEIKEGKGVTKRNPFLKIAKKTADTTEILLDMNQEDTHAYLYLKELMRQISETYPETRRSIFIIDPRTTIAMDKKLFEYWIIEDPDSFMSWCNEFLGDTYPGAFYKVDKYEETITHVKFQSFPQDDQVKFWEMIFFATEIKFPKTQIFSEPYILNRGPVASIKVTPIGNKKLQVRCSCELNNGQMIDWLTNLKTEIEKSPFQIRTKSRNAEDKAEEALPKQSETKKNKKLRAKGPSIDTQQKFIIFKEYKDKDPSLKQYEVAHAVNAELGTDYSAHNVSYAYKACGYKWE
jgi:hypothetical protein